MRNYIELLAKIMAFGDDRVDRTKVGTRALFGEMLRWDLSEGFPLVTTKFVNFDLVKAELIWFLSGSSDVKELQKLGCNIWNKNANADYWVKKAKFPGDLGRIYGVQWRSWRSIDEGDIVNGIIPLVELDQFVRLIECLKNDRADRRMIVSAWNPGELDQMALPPCHLLLQCFVRRNKYLDLIMYQRSCDTFLGVPFNIASYALLTHMLAQVVGLEAGILKILFADVHIYDNHRGQVLEQIRREPFGLCRLKLNPDIKDIDSFTMDDINIEDYEHHPQIKGEMAV